ncbi:MAG: DUF2478 domain-containing protein [Candidatus Aminicenantes bacterium]|nr:DUF2478 domain-containing protein [Candidatus Aminicenantes bacterium]
MIVLVSGRVGAGKSTLVRKAAVQLRRRGVPLAGFRSERVFGGDELRGYDLVDLADGKRTPWLRRGSAGERIGPYAVVPEGKAAAAEIIGRGPTGAILVVDELGPAELAGRGFWPWLVPLLDDEGRSFLFVVRTACLPAFKKLFAGRPVRIFRTGPRALPENLVSLILAHGRQG